MGWLRFDLPLEEQLQVEFHVRQIRACNDIEQLRGIAERAFRAWCAQADVSRQLIGQVADAEEQLARLGVIDEPAPDYVRWARELSMD